MRTTLVLDDSLFDAAKRRAADQRTTLSEIMNDALRQLLARRPGRRRIKLPTWGDPKERRNVTPRQIAEALLEHD